MNKLIEETCAGDIRAAAKLITHIENNFSEAKRIIEKLKPYTGKAHIIGITGPPGAGKSTLTSKIIKEYRKKKAKIGVIAIDPSSPFSGGAVLGDRIRMQGHSMDGKNVFIRSMATRGFSGGLAEATQSAAYVMDAVGMEIIIIETVGIGQSEVNIINIAHTTVVVLVPGMGDFIQTLKSGIMEIADIFIINKIDQEGAEKTESDILNLLSYSPYKNNWTIKIFKTNSLKGVGIDSLVEGFFKHRKFCKF